MKILFLQPQPCIRALKYAAGLKWALGGKVYIVFGYLYHTLTRLYGHGDEFFDELEKLDANDLSKDIKRLVDKHRPQLIHSHNAPDLLTISAIEAVGGSIPIIHDCHEALSLRETGYYVRDDDAKISAYSEQEKIAHELSDGRIYVTEGVKDYIQQRYSVNPEKDMVFYSYVSKSVIPSHLEDKLSRKDGQTHIVYIGTVTSLIEGSHYDLREIFKEIANRKMHIHIYVSLFGLADKAYEELAAKNRFIHHHGHLNQRKLLQEMTQYDYGWAGFNTNEKNEKHVGVALPNKIFEYIACGLPVLAFPHKTVRRFIEENEVGFVLNDLDELADQLKNGRVEKIKRNILKARYKFTVENNISKVIFFYRDLCGLNGGFIG